MSFISRRAATVDAGLVAVTPISRGLAQKPGTWPEKAIKYICPFPPGGGSDFAARVLARHRHPAAMIAAFRMQIR